MEQNVQDRVDAMIAQDSWTFEDSRRLTEMLARTPDGPARLSRLAAELAGGAEEPKGAEALKLGLVRYALCQFEAALRVLGDATDNKDRRYVQALCLKHLGHYAAAIEEVDRAQSRGWEPPEEMDLERAELLALSGDTDAAGKEVSALEKKMQDSPDWLYVRGLVHELSGDGERAVECYTRAREIEPGHPRATFRLAFYCDLHGDEEEAVELYRECVSRPPVHAHALLNLAVLYEDAGRYDEAENAVRTVLAANPNHLRARLFLRDIASSRTMYYDEDQAKRIARRNAVLDIPVTDFELSVRARNCLKKMNIRSLGDLIRTTEAELLGYKNFGETSLKEIKDMLAPKGLRLGQALEEDSDFGELPPPSAEGPPQDEGILATRVEDLNLSIRAARTLENLGVQTLGDLVQRTEAEMLACKNFGQTSLNEIRERLSEHGLSLRDDE